MKLVAMLFYTVFLFHSFVINKEPVLQLKHTAYNFSAVMGRPAVTTSS